MGKGGTKSETRTIVLTDGCSEAMRRQDRAQIIDTDSRYFTNFVFGLGLSVSRLFRNDVTFNDAR